MCVVDSTAAATLAHRCVLSEADARMVVVGPVPELCSYHGDTRMFQHIESPVVEGVVPPSMFKDRQAHVIGLDDTRSNVHDHTREEIPSIDPMAEPARHK